MDDGNSDGKIMLIDYECICYNYRGFDLGGHFVNQMMNWKGKETKLPGLPYPDKEQRQRFLAFYLQAIVEDVGELTESDTIDHLMLEADIGSLMYLCYMLILMMKYVDKFIPDPTMLMAVRFLFDFYQKHKETVRGSIQ
jgi:thiamine kinase-like enzyme